jgi:hypothetical protein
MLQVVEPVVRAERVVLLGGGVVDQPSPTVRTEPAGAESAHLVDPATAKTLCGVDASAFALVSRLWTELQPFYKCPRCLDAVPA